MGGRAYSLLYDAAASMRGVCFLPTLPLCFLTLRAMGTAFPFAYNTESRGSKILRTGLHHEVLSDALDQWFPTWGPTTSQGKSEPLYSPLRGAVEAVTAAIASQGLRCCYQKFC